MPQPPKADDVRSRILREATRLFAEKGYNGTSIQAISEAVGIKRPTLVYHFGSKERLRGEVVGSLIAHWQAELPRLMAAAKGGGPRLDALLRALFHFFLEDRNRARLILREMLDAPDAVGSHLRAKMQPLTGLLTHAVGAGQDSGVIRRDIDAESYILLMISMSIGTLAIGDRVNALIAPEPSLEQQLDELVRIAKTSLIEPKEV